jgi:hypothetical protein
VIGHLERSKEAFGSSFGRDGHINIEEDSFDWTLEVLVPFLRNKSDGRATSPPTIP